MWVDGVKTGSEARKAMDSQLILDHTGLHAKCFRVYLQETGSLGEIKAERAHRHSFMLKVLLIG